MKRWYKVIITHLDCAPPVDLLASGATQEEIDKAMEEKRKNWPPVLLYEVECQPDDLMKELMKLASADLGIGLNRIEYELEDAYWIGEA